MSGILGVWNRDGAPVNSAVLARMSATLAHRGPDGNTRRLDGSLALVHHHLRVTPEEIGESQPLTNRHGVSVALDGRLDNRDELLGPLGLAPSASDAACVLAAYDAWGEDFPRHLNGDFALAVCDPRRPHVVLARDSLGVRPLYYFCNDRFLAFASEIKALLAHPSVPSRPDDDGLADFLLLGARPLDHQETTCFAGISAVVPAHVVLVSPDRVTVQRYWDFDTGASLRLRSFEEYREAFHEKFAEAVRRRTRAAGPVAVSVSGGLDSSSIFCQGETLGRKGGSAHPLVGISYSGKAGSDADEVRYLVDIEREYGVAIDRIPIDPLLGLVGNADEQIRAVEAPFLDYMWGVSRAVRVAARARGARVLLSGHWGDQVLFSSAYLVDLARRWRWGEIGRHLREYGRWLGTGHTSVLRRRFLFEFMRDWVPTALVPPLKRLRRRFFAEQRPKAWFADDFLRHGLRFASRPATIGSGFHSAQARSLYVEARSKYHVHCLEWNNKVTALCGLDAAFPFLDRDLLAFLMAIPGEVQNRGGVPRALLREAMRGVLPEPVRARVWKADFSLAVNEGIIRDFEHIARALSPAAAAVRHGYLRADRLAEEVQELARGLHRSDCVDSWDLADMFGLEVWLQLFFTQGAPPAGRPAQLQESAR